MSGCRPGCAACCIAISISSSLPLHPQGKPAGTICGHLDRRTLLCTIWGQPHYPNVCRNFPAHPDHCGHDRAEALRRLRQLEAQTRPAA